MISQLSLEYQWTSLNWKSLSFLVLLLIPMSMSSGILYPQESESRELKSLDGIWNFRIGDRNDTELGFREQWYKKPLQETGNVQPMPVPSSYNDLTQDRLIRDHIGWVWYDHEFWIPQQWMAGKNRIFLRFGGVNYHAIVWINGVQVLEHSGGHLPFLTELTAQSQLLQQLLKTKNRITVALDNTLSLDTVPQGEIFRPSDPRYPDGYFTLNYNFDFFNYAGIHRSVFLYTTPETYIDDLDIKTSFSTLEDSTIGTVEYQVKVLANLKSYASLSKHKVAQVSVKLEDKTGLTVAEEVGESGRLQISKPNLWWPFTMVANDSDAGYLYTLVVSVSDIVEGTKDVYRLLVGIRSVRWTDTSFFINDRPFYFRGFGRHEDFNVRGKGIDNVMIVKDHNLVKWTGANSYRTSHYPYAEEIMDLADRLGIVIIDECPAVSLKGFGPKLLANHLQSLRELMQRDKNRPSVVMWSVANEPQSQLAASEDYFKNITEACRSLDQSRPLTLVTNNYYNTDKAAKFLDIICINRYFSWYSDTGHTEVIEKSVIGDVQKWVTKFNKPVIVAEYGADTIAGVHTSPDFVFSEEYQLTLMREHFKAFDFLRKNTTFIGEHIWNFADFMTAQGITRMNGNRKGIFTRDRQPKASAHYLRMRYHLLAKESDQYPLPLDLAYQYPIFNV